MVKNRISRYPGNDTHSSGAHEWQDKAGPKCQRSGGQTGTSAKPLRHCPSAAIGRQRFAAGSYTWTFTASSEAAQKQLSTAR